LKPTINISIKKSVAAAFISRLKKEKAQQKIGIIYSNFLNTSNYGKSC